MGAGSVKTAKNARNNIFKGNLDGRNPKWEKVKMTHVNIFESSALRVEDPLLHRHVFSVWVATLSTFEVSNTKFGREVRMGQVDVLEIGNCVALRFRGEKWIQRLRKTSEIISLDLG